EVGSHADERNDGGAGRAGCRSGGQRVRDSAPLLDGHGPPVPVDDAVPYHRAQNTYAHQTVPYVSFLNTAMAPMSPAVPGSCAETSWQASCALLNERRRTSARRGANRCSPA